VIEDHLDEKEIAMFKDFREYLDYLEKNGKLFRVRKEVDVRFEIAAGIRKISDTDGPALLFENVKGFPGWKMAGGTFGTKKLLALTLGTEPNDEKILQRYLEFDQKRIKPKLVSSSPVKEIIIKGDDIDLSKLPIPTFCEKDSGPYLVGGVDIAKDPKTGIQNASIHRREILGKDKTALDAVPRQHLGQIVLSGEEMGKGVGVASVIGSPPELSIASQINAPFGVDESEIAGAIRGEPLEMVKCETIDVEVPAHAEMVIEGVVIPGERKIDGPFGEFTGDYWSTGGHLGTECSVVKITAIMMRKNPIYHAILSGMPMTDNHWIKKYALAAGVYREVERLVPYREDIKGVNILEAGTGFTVVVSVYKRSERTPLDIIYTLLSSHMLIKNAIVVDDDINPYDLAEVTRAWTTRMIPGKDVIIPSAPGVEYATQSNRLGMNATANIKSRQWVAKAVPPGVDKVDYI
jgi:UbiD family decarboxylase